MANKFEQFINPELSKIDLPDLTRYADLIDPYFVISTVIQDISAATTANYGVFFIAPFSCEIIEAWESHKTAGTDAGAVTLDLEKLTGTQALDAGVSAVNGTWNLKAAIDTTRRLRANTTAIQSRLAPNNRLALKDTGTLTAVAHVCVTVLFKVLQTQTDTSLTNTT